MKIKLSEDLVCDAQIYAKVFNRTLKNQLEYWIKIGKIMEDNPDLSYEFVKNLLIARQEALTSHLEPYKFE